MRRLGENAPEVAAATAVAAILGRSLSSVMIAIAVVNIPLFARLLRGSMLGQRESDYVTAATSLGVKKRKVVLGHTRHCFVHYWSNLNIKDTLARLRAASMASSSKLV